MNLYFQFTMCVVAGITITIGTLLIVGVLFNIKWITNPPFKGFTTSPRKTLGNKIYTLCLVIIFISLGGIWLFLMM